MRLTARFVDRNSLWRLRVSLTLEDVWADLQVLGLVLPVGNGVRFPLSIVEVHLFQVPLADLLEGRVAAGVVALLLVVVRHLELLSGGEAGDFFLYLGELPRVLGLVKVLNVNTSHLVGLSADGQV
uniref:Uncharacterized protein n=1 Tax=Strombidium inclinatum TaxID=197538 RepID=A0A7S3IGT5_9SPIT